MFLLLLQTLQSQQLRSSFKKKELKLLVTFIKYSKSRVIKTENKQYACHIILV
jgi:hypothetical protein